MKDYNSDSTVVLDRFARDKRKRTTTVERIERRPGPRRDADDTPARTCPTACFVQSPTSRKTTDPSTSAAPSVRRFQIWRRPAFGVLPGPSGRAPFGSFGRLRRRAFRGGGSSASLREETLRCAEIRRQACLRAQIRRQSSGPSAPTASREGISVTANVGGAPKRYGPKSAGGFKRDDRRGEVRPKSYPRYNPNVQTGEIRLEPFHRPVGTLLAPRGRRLYPGRTGFGQRRDRDRIGIEGEADRRGEVQRQPHRGGKEGLSGAQQAQGAMSLRSKIPTPTRR